MDLKKYDTLLFCSNPQKIRNKYTHEVMVVSCGKCHGCLTRKLQQKTMLYDRHLSLYPFVFFVTLTYSDEFVPVFHDEVENKDMLVVSVRDCQLYHKRLFKACKNYSDEKVFYLLTAEYGSTTKRPHYHCLYGFVSQQLAENFSRLVFESWSNCDSGCKVPLGRIDVQSVIGSATQYVVSYLNCNSELPAKLIENGKPFCLASRLPQTGLNGLRESDVYQFYTFPVNKFVFERIGEQSLQYLPVFRNFKDRFFPKCRSFNTLSFRQKRFLYTLCRFTTKDRFTALLLSKQFDPDSCFSPCRTIGKLFFSESFDGRNKVYVLDEGSIDRAFYTSVHFVRLCERFHFSEDLLLYYICNFYAKSDYELLLTQLQFEEQFSFEFGVDYLPCLALFVDPLFYNNERGLRKAAFSLMYDSFNFHSYGSLKKSLVLYKEKRDLVKNSFDVRFSKHIKSKVKNDYLLAHPEYVFTNLQF